MRMKFKTSRPARKHLVLLVALVGILLAQPMVGYRSVAHGALVDLAFGAILLYLLSIVFDEGRQRWTAVALILGAFVSNLASYAVPSPLGLGSLVAFHSFLLAFLGFAVAVILRDILTKSVVGHDDVVGAICGYLLLGLVWANLYTLTYLFVPEAFSVNPDIASRLAVPHERRALFDYLSFTTLMTLGYSDITPIGPPAYTLTWLETMFGQFYLAVVVAQLVGLKLAQALRDGGPEAK